MHTHPYDTTLASFLHRFKSLLAQNGSDGSQSKDVEISDVKYNIFQVGRPGVVPVLFLCKPTLTTPSGDSSSALLLKG